jgi:hypothetical protein
LYRDGFEALAKKVTVRGGGRAQSARSPSRPRVRVLRAAVLALALGAVQGCYTYTPVITSQPPGTVLAFDINDRGRVELGDLVGPSAARIEGRLRSEDDTVYVVNVSSVTYLHGQTNQWAGETLTIRKTGVAGVREREFSASRTALAAGAAIGGVVAFIVSRDLFGFGPGPREGNGTEPPVEQ